VCGIIFENKQYKKEEFVYYPSEEEPQKRMMYCSAFYNLVIREKAKLLGKSETELKSHYSWTQFVSKFLRLYSQRTKECKPITWDDFKNLDL